MLSFFNHFIQLLMVSAPWLLLGFIIAGLMKVLIPQAWLHKHLGHNTPLAVIKAAFIGAPLPLCSCGVIPAALGLRHSGASKASTTAFLISTPETGIDSISITYAFMGWFMAIVRPIAAIASAITAGLLVLRIEKQEQSITQAKAEAPHQCSTQTQASSCCSSTPKESKPDSTHACCSSQKPPTNSSSDSSCCSVQANEPQGAQTEDGWASKIKEGLRFSLLDLSKDIALWLVIGLLLAALIETFVSVEWLAKWGSGWQAFLVMALIGVPMYICATSSTPIAAALLYAGVSPGAVLVFMLVGPATNITTVSMVRQELGTKALVVYLFSIILISFVFGWAINMSTTHYELNIAHTHSHQTSNSYIAIGSSFILSALLLRGLWMRLRSEFSKR